MPSTDSKASDAPKAAHQAATPQVQVPLQEETSGAAPLFGGDRYAGRGEMTPPADEAMPVGNAVESRESGSAEQAVNLFDNHLPPPGAEDSGALPPAEAAPYAEMPAATEHADQPIETTAATEATPFDTLPAEPLSTDGLPLEPPQQGGPLISEAEVELQPHPDAGPSIVQPTGAKEPTLAEPRILVWTRCGCAIDMLPVAACASSTAGGRRTDCRSIG